MLRPDPCVARRLIFTGLPEPSLLSSPVSFFPFPSKEKSYLLTLGTTNTRSKADFFQKVLLPYFTGHHSVKQHPHLETRKPSFPFHCTRAPIFLVTTGQISFVPEYHLLEPPWTPTLLQLKPPIAGRTRADTGDILIIFTLKSRTSSQHVENQ